MSVAPYDSPTYDYTSSSDVPSSDTYATMSAGSPNGVAAPSSFNWTNALNGLTSLATTGAQVYTAVTAKQPGTAKPAAPVAPLPTSIFQQGTNSIVFIVAGVVALALVVFLFLKKK